MKTSTNFPWTILCCMECALLIQMVGCAALTPSPSPTPILLPSPTFTPLPSETLTPPLPTATSTPTPTLRPTLVTYPGPARLYLPQLVDFPEVYETDTNNASDNVMQLGPIPVAPENIAAISFCTKGGSLVTGAQNDVYMRFLYWVIVAPDAATARVLFTMTDQPEWQKKAFLVFLPAEVDAPVTSLAPIPTGQMPCEESNLLSIGLYPYAAYRTGPLPTVDLKAYRPMDPKVLASLSPDLYLFAPCRVQNVLVMFWGYTANNYDGKMAPIPTDVLIGQVSRFLKVVTAKVTAQVAPLQ